MRFVNQALKKCRSRAAAFQKTILVIFSVFSLISRAQANSRVFYDMRVDDNWKVIGIVQYDGDTPFCAIQREWDDGSLLNISRSVEYGGFSIWFKNVSWHSPLSADKKYKLRLKTENPQLSNLDTLVDYVWIDPQTIMIAHVDDQQVLNGLAGLRQLYFDMGEAARTVQILVEPSAAVMWRLNDCGQQWGVFKNGTSDPSLRVKLKSLPVYPD